MGVQRGRLQRPAANAAPPPEAPPRVARRSSRPVRTSPAGRGVGTITLWPLDANDGYPSPSRETDPWARLVRENIELYRTGRADEARRMWSDDIVWKVWGSDESARELRGPDAIFAYHSRLARLTDGTFRQRLLAVEGSRGPVVTAYLRTHARRGDREIDIPSLVTFEACRMHIERVTELPGDQAEWDAFWAD